MLPHRLIFFFPISAERRTIIDVIALTLSHWTLDSLFTQNHPHWLGNVRARTSTYVIYEGTLSIV